MATLCPDRNNRVLTDFWPSFFLEPYFESGWTGWAGWADWQARAGWGLQSRMYAVTAYNFYLSCLEGFRVRLGV